MAAPSTACADCPVRDSAVCAALDPDELESLARVGRHRTFQRGETIFAAGDDSIACATLITGAAKLSSLDADGTERIVALVHPAGFLGQLFTGTSRHDVTALTDSHLCIFPRAEFEKMMEDHPRLTRTILERTLAELDASRALTDLIGRRDVKARLAGLILSLSRAASPSPCGSAQAFDLPLTREEIASLLGTTIETISRRMTELEQGGAIKRKGARGIEILSAPRLGEAAGT